MLYKIEKNTLNTKENLYSEIQPVIEKKVHVLIADNILKTYKVKYYSGELYIYYNNVYISDTSILERFIIQTNNNLKERDIKDILYNVRIRVSGEIIEPNRDYINFKNGLFNIKNNELIKHTPDIFTINRINASYHSNYPMNGDIIKFLNDVANSNPDRVKALLQIIGYSLTSSVEFQKAFIFYGETAENGKSTLLEVINALIGENNISHVSIHDLQKTRFCASELGNKLLNCVSELPRSNLESLEVFKAVVTGDAMSVEEKFKKRYAIKPYAKHIFTANELPSISDNTNGFYRRINILKFEAQFSEEKKANFNISNLLKDEALNYLARISLEAYLELLKTRHFANEEESNSLIEEYKKRNDSVLYYINESSNFEKFISNKTTFQRIKLYEDYLQWCHTLRIYNPVGKNTFYAKICKSNMFENVIIHGKDSFKIII